ncbi:MAG: CBS domain-containing protein, partial [Planctomycetota bacterium]
AEAKVRLTVAAAKAQAKEKARLQSEMVARIKAQAEAQHAVAEIQTNNQEHIAQAKAKAQAEADQTIAAIKSQTELQIAEIETKTDLEIIRVRSESEQKLRNYAQRLIKQKARTRRIIAKQKGKTAKEQKAYAEKISKIKSRTEKTAKDIMHKDILWARPDDSVEQTLAKMQDPDIGYALVGTGGALEGVVSKSDLTGAISPYLRPAFAKWRRPLDDATLQIKIKWIMNRTVQTVTPDMTLTEITRNILHLADQQPLVVTDRQGKVRGLITLFDITNAMLDDGSVEDAK